MKEKREMNSHARTAAKGLRALGSGLPLLFKIRRSATLNAVSDHI